MRVTVRVRVRVRVRARVRVRVRVTVRVRACSCCKLCVNARCFMPVRQVLSLTWLSSRAVSSFRDCFATSCCLCSFRGMVRVRVRVRLRCRGRVRVIRSNLSHHLVIVAHALVSCALTVQQDCVFCL